MWNFPLFPDQASSLARQVDELYFFELGIAGFFTALIFLLIVTFAVVYRRRSRANRSNPPMASKLMEVIWIGVPLLLGLVMFTWGARSILHGCTSRPAMHSKLRWSVNSGCGICSTPRAVPRSTSCTSRSGRPIKLTMTSQDVIHSFYVPAFRVKQDVLAGPVHHDCGSSRRRSGAIIFSVPSIAERIIRRWGVGSR